MTYGVEAYGPVVVRDDDVSLPETSGSVDECFFHSGEGATRKARHEGRTSQFSHGKNSA